MSQTVESIKQIGLKHAEAMLTEVVNTHFEEVAAKAAQELKDAIPGNVDDVVVDFLMANYLPKVKADLLAKIAELHQE